MHQIISLFGLISDCDMKKILIPAILMLCNTLICCGWGTTGHKAIVEIAKRHLSAKAAENISAYIPYDITDDARWMDSHRNDPELSYMYHFHEQCINLRTLEYDPNAQVRDGDIMRGLWLADYNLSHRDNLPDSVVVLNLRMLLHFIGDLHCPVHLGVPGIWFPKPPYRQDVGKWYYRGKAFHSFHKFIDEIPDILYPGLDYKEIAGQIDRKSRHLSRKCVKGDFVGWTNDATRRGYRIYDYYPPLWEIPDSPDPKAIPDDFPDNVRDIIAEELAKAGYQLAFLLNIYFGK